MSVRSPNYKKGAVLKALLSHMHASFVVQLACRHARSSGAEEEMVADVSNIGKFHRRVVHLQPYVRIFEPEEMSHRSK